MSSEFDTPEEPRNWTKWVWLGIGVGVALMILVLFITQGRQRSTVSRVHAKHILIRFDRSDPESKARAYEQIMELRERLVQGEDFGALARQYSMDPETSQRGGDLGWKVKGDFEDQFEEFVWETGIDEISPVITTRYGYHLIVVVDRVLTAADAYERRLHEEVTTEEEPDAGKDATPDPA